MSESTTPVHGACLCGAVRFEVTPPTRFCAHCHCTMCRRAHMAPLVTWSGVPDGQLKITAGETLLTRYASSAEATRSFCSVCGSPLFFESTRWPGETHIATTSLIEGPDKLPNAHVHFSTRVDWYECHDELRKLGGPTGFEPL
jgi:hypothetical protein